ncbi:hypothetical protein Taro_024015 [Colocasia esculenta]|uniref:Uncharacterized protein n=1 Tax=Colocasia esculenta TaxID=4460 RepID=A0A843V5N4_COLES|nr:hypothetical protein [Colocasia esculenta]
MLSTRRMAEDRGSLKLQSTGKIVHSMVLSHPATPTKMTSITDLGAVGYSATVRLPGSPSSSICSSHHPESPYPFASKKSCRSDRSTASSILSNHIDLSWLTLLDDPHHGHQQQ